MGVGIMHVILKPDNSYNILFNAHLHFRFYLCIIISMKVLHWSFCWRIKILDIVIVQHITKA